MEHNFFELMGREIDQYSVYYYEIFIFIFSEFFPNFFLILEIWQFEYFFLRVNIYTVPQECHGQSFQELPPALAYQGLDQSC